MSIKTHITTIENALFLLKDCNQEVKEEQMQCISEAVAKINYEYNQLQDENRELEEENNNTADEDDTPYTELLTIADCRTNMQMNLDNPAVYADNLGDQMALNEFIQSLYYKR